MVHLEDVGRHSVTTTAQDMGLIGCRRCSKVWSNDKVQCDRCGASLSKTTRKSLYWVWFWWVLGVIAYIPANLWPMLETRVLFRTSDDTIVVGAWKLANHGSVVIALVILLASVAIPLAKFAVIAFLALSVQRPKPLNMKLAHRLYEWVEWVGRWSMIDVFVVAILSSLVQFSFVATVKPGTAALAFAISVICTMIAAQRFDSRLIWDRLPAPDTDLSER